MKRIAPDNIKELVTPRTLKNLERVRLLLDESFSNDDPRLDEVFGKLRSDWGKMLRPLLTLSVAELKGGVLQSHIVSAAVLEMVHTASLLHDDVIDSTFLRRERTSFNSMFGCKNAILMGDLLVSKAFVLARSEGGDDIFRMLFNTMAVMSRAELLQNVNRDNINIDEQTYLEIITGKTAELFSVSCLLGALDGHGQSDDQAVSQFGRNFGIAYQLLNDYNDIFDTEKKDVHRFCDLKNGCFTMPLIHCLCSPVRPRIIKALKDENMLKALELLKENGSDQYTLSQVARYRQLSLDSLGLIESKGTRQSLVRLTDACLAHS